MAVEMIMPKVDMDQETGTVVDWLKGDGQKVEKGETILVIETDKIAIDVESPGTGTLKGISAQPGDIVPIGTVIAYILEENEELPENLVESDMLKPASSDPEGEPSLPINTKVISATPVAENMASAHDVDLSQVEGSGRGGKITKVDVKKILSRMQEVKQPQKFIATPAARRKARIEDVALESVQGTGPEGRIQAFDVENYLGSQQSFSLPNKPKPSSGKTIPLRGMRRTIADRMTKSYQSIPHIQFTTRVDMTKFLATRNDYNELAQDRGDQKVSVTALMVKAVAMVLKDHPWLNSSLVGDEITIHTEINIGVAVALEQGLIVPVVHNVHNKGVREIAREVNDLVARARGEDLNNKDIRGATFTITNLGPYGVEQFNAIINPPEAAILAVGTTTAEAVPLPDGKIVSRPIMRFTLSADHRIVDGAVAAYFIRDLKTILEKPALINY